MSELDKVTGWVIQSYDWPCDEDFQICFARRGYVPNLEGRRLIFSDAIAVCALGPWGTVIRHSSSPAVESGVGGLFDVDEDELSSHVAFSFWTEGIICSAVTVIAESVSIETIRLVRGSDL